MKIMNHFNKHSKMLTRLAYTLVLSVFLTACTATQQDKLFGKMVNFKRWDAGVTTKQLNIDGLNYSFLIREPKKSVKNPQTIVLLHGFSTNKDNWLYFIDSLPNDFRIIAPDAMGHGDSSGDASFDYNLNVQAKRLHKLLVALKLKRYHLVGNSMGGAMTMLYHKLYPDTVQSMTLMNAAGVDGETESPFFKQLKQGKNILIAYDRPSFDSRLTFITEKSTWFRLPWPMKNALSRIDGERKPINEKIFTDMWATRDEFTEDVIKENFAELVKLGTPTLIMWGLQDRVLDPSAVDKLKELVPYAEIAVYPGVGHLPMLEIPGKSAKRIAEFVEKASKR